MSNQTIIDFCKINEEYDVLIDYFKTKKIFDFKQFQDNQKDICFYLNESFPTIDFSKLRDSIYEFENLQNQSSIYEVDQFVSKKDFDELKENFLKLENYVKNELNKFDNPQVIAASKADGDFFIKNKWLVKGSSLLACAQDNSSFDGKNLFDSVFGQQLKDYNSLSEMPSEFREAFNELLDHFADAKVSVYGGNYIKVRKEIKDRLCRMLVNRKHYKKTKKSNNN